MDKLCTFVVPSFANLQRSQYWCSKCRRPSNGQQPDARHEVTRPPCDRCGAPGVCPLILIGAPQSVDKAVEAEFGGRARFIAFIEDGYSDITVSIRGLSLCASCHPAPEHILVLVERGYEGFADRWMADRRSKRL